MSKALLQANRRTWALTEQLWSDPSVRCVGGDPIRLRLFDVVDGGAATPGIHYELEAQGDILIFLFWAHNWSGEAYVKVDGAFHTLDLYSREAGFRRLEIKGLSSGRHHVEIGATGIKHPESFGQQVIFYKVVAYAAARETIIDHG